MGVHVDPEKLLGLAKQVYNDPTGKMYNAQVNVKTATVSWGCFGLLGAAIMSGPYESARADFEKCLGDATAALTSAANGMANVATIYEQAENANTMVLSVGLPNWAGANLPSMGISSIPVEGALGLIAFGGLGIIFDLVLGAIYTTVALAPITIAAVSLWTIAEPDDGEINATLQRWNTASGNVTTARADLTQILTGGLQDAWPTGDGARDAFDGWIKSLDADLALLEKSIGAVPGTINSAVTDIHVCSEWLLGIITSALATLIAVTALDIFFGAGEGAKSAIGVSILAAVSSTTTTVVGILAKMAYDIGVYIRDRGRFSDASTGLPDFTKISDPLAWQTPAPTSTGP